MSSQESILAIEHWFPLGRRVCSTWAVLLQTELAVDQDVELAEASAGKPLVQLTDGGEYECNTSVRLGRAVTY